MLSGSNATPGKACGAILFARQEASRLPTRYISTEHLWLALMREEVLLGIRLRNQRGSAEGLRQELDRGIETTRQPIPTSRDLPLSREA